MKINAFKVTVIMANKKISISQLVTLSKMSSRTVNKLLKGKDCNIVTIGKLAESLDIDVAEIIENKED